VPIKHHLLARLRAWMKRERKQLSTWESMLVGTGETPLANFRLEKIEQLLAANGWDSRVVASVNNFRRWDQGPPAWVISLLRPVIYRLEMVGQRVGRGWWGPSQFIWATRRELHTAQGPMAIQPPALCSTPWAALAMKMICPTCRLSLRWSDEAAYCESCSCVFPCTGPIWDFVPGNLAESSNENPGLRAITSNIEPKKV
jgi:hypothetical protein